jgi:hypothetical protein
MSFERKATDKELADFIIRVPCTREHAESIPLKTLLNIIKILPTKPIPLTKTELEFGQELAKKIANGYHQPLKTIKRIEIPKPKNSN